MITELSIRGLAIIDSLTIAFSPGFNVITGETGAGKSILIKGLHFLLGGKTATDAIRTGAEQATVTGAFVVPQGHPALGILDRAGIAFDYADHGGGLLVRRQLTLKGRSQGWINDTPVTNALLREVGGTLVDVFGQHENQRLLNESHHLEYLDAFLSDPGKRDLVRDRVREAAAKVDALKELVATFHARTKDHDYFAFRLTALRDFKPTVEDYESVQSLCTRGESEVRSKAALNQAMAAIDSEDEGPGPAARLRDASRVLVTLGKELAPLSERADALASEIDELSYELGKLGSRFDVDEREVEAAQERLFGYQDLLRKHGVREITELVEEETRLGQEIAFVESAAETLASEIAGLAKLAEEVVKLASQLSTSRKKAAELLEKRVQLEMRELSMPGARLKAELVAVQRTLPALDLDSVDGALVPKWNAVAEKLSKVGDQGAERCQFLLSSNPGEPLMPLARVASGGEMSRIMLALKKSLVVDAETCVLVFDEIDTGISGRVADVVGRKMRELSSSLQVLCISHLPQVAVYADTHFLVKKAGTKRTESTILRLSADESAKEIARLLSGAEVSKTGLANARALIKNAREGKPLSA